MLPSWAEGRILRLKQAPDILAPWRRCYSIAWTNGCFDLVHPSHVHLLWQAAQEADILVVGVNSDESVRAIKGPDRPICPEIDRALVVLAMKWVDYVVIFDEVDPRVAIDTLRPEVVVMGTGSGRTPEQTPEYPLISEYGGRIANVTTFSHKTTDIINSILTRGRVDADQSCTRIPRCSNQQQNDCGRCAR